MDLSDEQRRLLARMQRRSIIFTGAETEGEHLAMLQLYIAGLVAQVSLRRSHAAMEWRLTPEGERALRKPEI